MDVWAIGIMTYCILFNRLPFTGTTREIIKNLISTSELVTPKEITVTPQCQQFLNGCLNKNPSDRITIKAMLDSPWFRLTEDQIEQNIQSVKDGTLKPYKIITLPQQIEEQKENIKLGSTVKRMSTMKHMPNDRSDVARRNSYQNNNQGSSYNKPLPTISKPKISKLVSMDAQELKMLVTPSKTPLKKSQQRNVEYDLN